jgi:hypothetical protein
MGCWARLSYTGRVNNAWYRGHESGCTPRSIRLNERPAELKRLPVAQEPESFHPQPEVSSHPNLRIGLRSTYSGSVLIVKLLELTVAVLKFLAATTTALFVTTLFFQR